MKEMINNMLYIDEIREKLGVSPRKCIYKIEEGEIIISSIIERETA